MVLNEDRARSCKHHGPENPALRCRLALNLARREPAPGSLRGELERAGREDAFLAQLIAQPRGEPVPATEKRAAA
ncbi:MAG TPA: hypothetical protein VFG43_10555 [Geminicoccaceae bacterium]|nr:hypothetical protein [Geminicoccaceae bacterium]